MTCESVSRESSKSQMLNIQNMSDHLEEIVFGLLTAAAASCYSRSCFFLLHYISILDGDLTSATIFWCSNTTNSVLCAS